MKNQWKRLALAGCALGMCLGVFQNCAGGADVATEDKTANQASVDPLVLQISVSQIQMSQSTSLSATGGTAPFVFSVDSGPGQIINFSSLQAGTSTGTVNVRVTDSKGATAVGSLAVIAAPTLASCTLPWGGTIADKASVTAYQTSTVACMGATCASQVRTCNNGTLSGTYTAQTCTVPACTYRWYNATSYTETHLHACTRVGKPVAADQGYGICASGEDRPKAGLGFAAIVYNHGTYGQAGVGGNIYLTGTAYYCYYTGQKHDNDNSDLVVAYLCREN